jgi:hypothetical protein
MTTEAAKPRDVIGADGGHVVLGQHLVEGGLVFDQLPHVHGLLCRLLHVR